MSIMGQDPHQCSHCQYGRGVHALDCPTLKKEMCKGVLSKEEAREMEREWRPGHQNTQTAVEQQRQHSPAGDQKYPRVGGPIRTFATGATRDTAEGKNDYEGFLSPLVLEAYGDYMTEHRRQSDGSLRDSDNWQRGIPKDAYIKSLLRHVLDFWKLHRGWPVRPEMRGGVLKPPTMKSLLCSIMFNTMGYLHEMLKEEIERERAKEAA